MSDFLEKLKSGNKEVFNAGIYTLKTGNLPLVNGTLPALLSSIIASGAIGSWLEYPELATKNGIVLGQTTIYSMITRDMLLNDNDITNSIFYMIKRNIETGLLDEKAQLEPVEDQGINAILNNMPILEASLNSKTYYDSFVNIYQSVSIRRKKSTQYSLAALRNDMVVDFQVFQDNHRLIKEAYLDKIDSYTKDDIDIVLFALKELQVVDEVINSIRKTLEANLVRRQNKENKRKEREKLSHIIPKIELPKKEVLSKKEYNLTYRELLTYYDLDNQQVLRPLSIKEVIYCVRLMLKLNIQESAIDTFIRNIDKENKKMSNPISLYVSLYDKISYYAKDTEISKKIALIEEYLEQIFICSEEDYEFWKSMIGEEVSELTKLLPATGEYEKIEAKKLSKS